MIRMRRYANVTKLVTIESLGDAQAVVAQHFHAYKGQPLSLSDQAAGPKAEYLEYHRSTVFTQ